MACQAMAPGRDVKLWLLVGVSRLVIPYLNSEVTSINLLEVIRGIVMASQRIACQTSSVSGPVRKTCGERGESF